MTETKKSKRSKRSLNTHNHKSASQEVTAEQKADYEKELKKEKARFLDRQKSKKRTGCIIRI